LALVVLEGPTASEPRYFHSAELAEHLRDVVDKGIGVIILLDRCHSGSKFRGNVASHCLPYSPEIDRKYLPKISVAQSLPKAVHEPGEPSSLKGSRHASIVVNWLACPDGSAILTLSDAIEKAYAVRFDK
jgi:hypothetical protein